MRKLCAHDIIHRTRKIIYVLGTTLSSCAIIIAFITHVFGSTSEYTTPFYAFISFMR